MVDLIRKLPGVFPPSKMSAAFRAIEIVLRNDPVLAAGIKNWRSWTGSHEDAQPFSPMLCPIVRIGFNSETRYVAEGLAETPLIIPIEAACAGTCADDVIDLWSAIADALVPLKVFSPGVTVQQYLRTCFLAPGATQPTGAYNIVFGTSRIFPGFEPDTNTRKLSITPTFFTAAGVFVASIVRTA